MVIKTGPSHTITMEIPLYYGIIFPINRPFQWKNYVFDPFMQPF